MKPQDDTIAAIITPIGEGGISVIRLSGAQAISIAERGFRGKQALSSVASHTVHFGSCIDLNGAILDEALATVFIAPHSYTGEDTVELSCHGSIFISKKILETFISLGARMAEPGEFTRRAFLNGKLDLTQAEAVADLIKTRSEQSHKASLSQLKGSTSKAINSIKTKLLNICSLVELELDFSEEGLEFIERTETINRLNAVMGEISALIQSFSHGRVLKEGVKVVIYGKPNVGKSSLMNALLDQERAIVTHISGTTRDTIEESIHIEGMIFRLVDTAGIRETDDIIEQEGINRTRNELQEADIVIHLLDGSALSREDFLEERSSLFSFVGDSSKIVTALNKADLFDADFSTSLEKHFSFAFDRTAKASGHGLVIISAKNRTGIDELKNHIHSLSLSHDFNSLENSVTINNLRHKDLLVKVFNSLENALASVRNNLTGEFIAVDLRASLNSLSEITGEITTDDILNNIFSNFCIGK